MRRRVLRRSIEPEVGLQRNINSEKVQYKASPYVTRFFEASENPPKASKEYLIRNPYQRLSLNSLLQLTTDDFRVLKDVMVSRAFLHKFEETPLTEFLFGARGVFVRTFRSWIELKVPADYHLSTSEMQVLFGTYRARPNYYKKLKDIVSS